MENVIPNPYAQDTTINEFLNLYVKFLSSWKYELDKTQQEIEDLQDRAERTTNNIQEFEKYIWGNLTKIIKMLPESTCPFCGGKVIDKAPLVPFLNQFEPYWEDDGYYWTDFWKGNKLKFNLECLHCHAFRTSEYSFNNSSFQKWKALDKRRPQIVSFIFQKYPFMKSVSRTKKADDWFFSFENGDFWEIEGSQDKVIKSLNLPDPMYCGR
jgi:transposase-like protein